MSSKRGRRLGPVHLLAHMAGHRGVSVLPLASDDNRVNERDEAQEKAERTLFRW
jgi:hypothetical protein